MKSWALVCGAVAVLIVSTAIAKGPATSQAMKACAASWKAMSAADRAKTTYKSYSTSCLLKRRTVTPSTGVAPPPSAAPAGNAALSRGAAPPTSAAPAGDAANGHSLFARCEVCHAAQKGAPNRIGPNLFGVVGRKAGTVSGYSYSSAMARSGIVWGPNTLAQYLMGPSKVVPGTKMTFAGFSNQQQANDVATYLATLK